MKKEIELIIYSPLYGENTFDWFSWYKEVSTNFDDSKIYFAIYELETENFAIYRTI